MLLDIGINRGAARSIIRPSSQAHVPFTYPNKVEERVKPSVGAVALTGSVGVAIS